MNTIEIRNDEKIKLLYRVHNVMTQREDIGGFLKGQNGAVRLVQDKENLGKQEPDLQLQQPGSLRPWLRCKRTN